MSGAHTPVTRKRVSRTIFNMVRAMSPPSNNHTRHAHLQPSSFEAQLSKADTQQCEHTKAKPGGPKPPRHRRWSLRRQIRRPTNMQSGRRVLWLELTGRLDYHPLVPPPCQPTRSATQGRLRASTPRRSRRRTHSPEAQERATSPPTTPSCAQLRRSPPKRIPEGRRSG